MNPFVRSILQHSIGLIETVIVAHGPEALTFIENELEKLKLKYSSPPKP